MAWLDDSLAIPEFPKRDPLREFADLKQLQPDGSPYRIPTEDWAGARQRIDGDPQWRSWFQKQKDALDRWMARHRDRVQWQGGWYHDFVSPKDGSFLQWTEKIPGEEIDHFTSSTGDRVEITPRIFGGWVFGFRTRHLDKMVDAGRMFHLIGDSRYVDWAAGQLDFYAANYEGWPVANAKGNYARLGCQSLDDAHYLTRLIETARLVFDHVTPDRRQVWYRQLFKPEAELLDRSFQVIHNIAVWHRATQAQVALLYGDASMWTRVIDGEYGLRAQLLRGVTGDYLWYEQSMGYNDYIVNATGPLLLFAGLTGKSAVLRQEAATIQNLMLAPLLLRFPDNTLPNPADSTGILKAPSRWLARSYRVLPTPLGLAGAAGQHNWDTLVDPPWEGGSPALPPVSSRHLESSRFVVLAKGPWQLFFHYGQVSRSHAQAEALNWSASYNGTDISHDPGTVGYGSKMTNGYYRRGLNHNVPLIDGEGQLPWNRGELTGFDGTRAMASAVQSDYRPGVETRRTLRIEGDCLVDEVRIDARKASKSVPGNPPSADAASPSPLSVPGLSLHLQGQAIRIKNFRPVPLSDFARGRPEPFRYWQDIRANSFRDRATLPVEFPGGLVLDVTFEIPGRFTVFLGTSPDRPPARRMAFYVEPQDRDLTKKPFIVTTRLQPQPVR
ncbi:Heparinase II/III-like protein [Opitutaceae bacterium TAV1]|nr:Heparinase II/III-like protein [Opitutaceae bacterium TAV1]